MLKMLFFSYLFPRRQSIIVTNYLFCHGHKRLTAEHLPASFGRHLQAKPKMQQNTDDKSSAGKLFVPVLTLAFFSTWIIESLTGVFLKDITITFFGSATPVSLATAGQLVT